MKLLSIVILLFLFFEVSGQQNFSEVLKNNWKFEEVKRIDGSKIYDNSILNQMFDIKVFGKDSLTLYTGANATNFKYQLTDSVLVFNKMSFIIKSVNDLSLVLHQSNIANEMLGLSLKFTPKKLADFTFSPVYYTAKNGDIVYKAVPGRLQPFFLDFENRSPMDFILEKFAFPEYRKGGFVVRFVITKKGDLKGIKIVATSNDRYNAKLISAVDKTQSKWMPAEFRDEKVNVELEYDFNLGFTNDTNVPVQDSVEVSNTYYGYGTEFFERKSYQQAATYYSKSIAYNPLNINAHYQRAASNIFLKKKEEACKDYNVLVLLEQKRAKTLFDKYCN